MFYVRLKISNFFKRIFSPPVFPGEEVKTTRAGLLHTITVSATIGLSLLIIGDLISGINPALTLSITILLLASLILVHHWLHSGKIFLSGIALPLIGYLMITGICLSHGTIQTPATAVYIFCVITAGAVFGKKGITISTIACSLGVLGIILAENAGMLAQPDYSDNYTEWILYTFLFGLTGALTYNINQITQNALERMKTEMREREHAEMEIRKLSRAVEQSPTSIVITDLEGNIEYVNPRFTQVTGYTREEAVGQNPRILKTELTPPRYLYPIMGTTAYRE